MEGWKGVNALVRMVAVESEPTSEVRTQRAREQKELFEVNIHEMIRLVQVDALMSTSAKVLAGTGQH